ncbi:hypothetical protein QYF61_026125 [Mycteria americana]|uniref:Uncharacterized protein n=1 Tax=Mycteria americana TaxID=33587 RepID=A0AAN7NN01_MYCAM|nr:hypothetical protein QYF61_026125 [Mycteria americana]
MGGTPCWSRGREEEGVVETTCGELTPTSIPIPLRHLGGGDRNTGSDVEPGKKRGVEGKGSMLRNQSEPEKTRTPASAEYRVRSWHSCCRAEESSQAVPLFSDGQGDGLIGLEPNLSSQDLLQVSYKSEPKEKDYRRSAGRDNLPEGGASWRSAPVLMTGDSSTGDITEERTLAKQPQFPQTLLIRLVLQTLPQLCCPSLDTLQPLNVSLVGAQNRTQYSRCGLTSAEYKGTITSLVLLATLFLIQARMPLAFLATWAHCWLIFRQLSTNTPRSFSARQLSSHSSPSL